MALDQDKLEAEILALGTEIFNEAQDSSLTVFDPEFYSGKLLDWAMRNEEFKINLFRFVDVLPALSDSAAVVAHAQEYFTSVADQLPGILKWGLNVDPNSITAKVAAQMIKKQIRSVAERFVLGEDPKSAMKPLRKLRKSGIAFTVDLLGEATVSEIESRTYLERYLELLDSLAKEVPLWPESKPLVPGHRGEDSAVNISVKLSALYSQTKAINTDKSVAILCDRFAEILSKAKAKNAFVYIDMEDASMVEITIKAYRAVLSRNEFKDFGRCGIVLQAYLRRTESDLDELISWSKTRQAPIAVRLVKGAYWDTETMISKQNGWGIPVFQQKVASDENYERLTLKLLENNKTVLSAFGSHNIRSLTHAVKAAELMGLDKGDYELQMLYGMAEPIKKAFVKRGYLLRDYSPIGELLPGMGYLVRRLLENTSNEGFLRQSFHEQERAEVLLKKPVVTEPENGSEHLNRSVRARFTNIPLTDFTIPENREGIRKALQSLRENLTVKPAVVRPIIGGREVNGHAQVDIISPEDHSFHMGAVERSDRGQADKAIRDLQQFFPTWRDKSMEERAEVLFRTAEILNRDRVSLIALIVYEAGKPWAEADADVVEAIDFLNYYAHEAVRLGKLQRLGDYPGEYNTYFYEPRGITLVISPWNFPIAIPCGMFSAALVTGNCAVIKPSEETSLIAQRMFCAFLEAGLPGEAAAFIPGSGSDVGAFMAEHPLISTIVFTGSRDVGLELINKASIHLPEAEHVKRVIAEMGGKNAIIIDDDADLDEAIRGVVYSAFGYQGQKCSACSRVIVVGSAYDKFLERLAEAVKSINVGPASDPATFVGPVINDSAFDRIQEIIEDAKKDCRLVIEGGKPADPKLAGYYIRPTVFTDIPDNHFILTNEIFGPVLAVRKAKSFAAAVEEACNSEYALTGAVYSRSPGHIQYAVRNFRIGNLYINRGSTGALVYRQPFGGAKMSGVGSKAGGPDYLLQFVIPRAVSENTIRRGFAPVI